MVTLHLLLFLWGGAGGVRTVNTVSVENAVQLGVWVAREAFVDVNLILQERRGGVRLVRMGWRRRWRWKWKKASSA